MAPENPPTGRLGDKTLYITDPVWEYIPRHYVPSRSKGGSVGEHLLFLRQDPGRKARMKAWFDARVKNGDILDPFFSTEMQRAYTRVFKQGKAARKFQWIWDQDRPLASLMRYASPHEKPGC